jgi:hypothetical protein
VMGGLELIVPGDWEIVNEISAILGDLSDKRTNLSVEDSPKRKLHLRGIAVLGGIEIKSL